MENQSNSVSFGSLESFGIDAERPLLDLLRTRIDPNCFDGQWGRY